MVKGNITVPEYGEIIRKRCLKREVGPGQGMDKGEAKGVESLSLYQTEIRIIEEVPQQRMADGLHVNPNLVGTSGFQQKRDQ